jgi:hypothetical protein
VSAFSSLLPGNKAKFKKEKERSNTVNAEEIKAYGEKVDAQLQEAKSRIGALEARHKEKTAQEEIAAIKAKNEEIEKKRHDLKHVSETKSAELKAEIEADLAKHKARLDHFVEKVKSHAATK